MAAPVVYHDVAPDANLGGQLFAGKKFWVAQRVFSRPRYLDLIRSNGGEVVLLEKKADYLIADPIYHSCPPGSISYTFIDESIANGEIQDPDNHRAGPPEGTARAPGSLSRPAKGTRAAYTAEEDMILYKWVHGCEKTGGFAKGNEIYKQLEKQHPRHTWQSWRDRYVKTLQQRPPSAFNIPDNAPPSPPSDTPVEPAPAPPPISFNKPTMAQLGAAPRNASGSKLVNSVEYTVEELTAPGLFEKEDWEMLYAFAPELSDWEGDHYRQGWRDWAAAKGRGKTAGQWRQYFEKVVWPMWRKDPEEKHERIRRRVEDRQEEENKQEAPQDEDEALIEQREPKVGPCTPTSRAPTTKRKRSDLDDELFESYFSDHHTSKTPSAYVLFARERKWDLQDHLGPEVDYAGLHRILMSRWDALSSEEKGPYFAREAAEKSHAANETATLSSQVFLSSSTVVNETPKYISEAYTKALHQLREGASTSDSHIDRQDETRQLVKRQRSIPPRLGTKQVPVEVSSAGTNSQQLTPDELSEIKPAERSIDDDDASDLGGLEAIAPPHDVLEPDAIVQALDSPTPRAPRYKAPAFDTQAILLSPSQSASLNPLPLPAHLTRLADAEVESSSEKLESDASTTESLQEFSQIVNEGLHLRGITPLPQPQHSSPPHSPSSTIASTSSGDPDPPLAPDEVDEYFEEQHAEGFPDDFIAEALKHTRWRPELATEVLQAWKFEQPLPNKRGIWSESDDEEVEGGNGMALARLESKHTLDGWGGVTERLNFLAKYRSAKM